MKFEFEFKNIKCSVRNKIPEENETIKDDMDIEKIMNGLNGITIYFRPKEACPFNRGNWIIDLEFINNSVHALKLPKEMSEESVMKFMKPLIDIFEESKNEIESMVSIKH